MSIIDTISGQGGQGGGGGSNAWDFFGGLTATREAPADALTASSQQSSKTNQTILIMGMIVIAVAITGVFFISYKKMK